jgi:predicted outer membrane repeat protein
MFGSNRQASRKNSLKTSARRRSKLCRRFEPLEDRRVLATFTVSITADRFDLTGLTPTHPYPTDVAGKTLSLREAIYLSNINPGPDTVIIKGKATYGITIAGAGEDSDATGDFDILDNLTIKSKGDPDPIVNGNGLDRVFDIPSGINNINLTLDDVVVTGGIARDGYGGGGVAAQGNNDTITVTRTSIVNNVATSGSQGYGGGIYDHGGNVSITNSHIDNNSAAAGVHGLGGGIMLDEGIESLFIKNSTFNGNSAYDQAGAIYGQLGQTTIINSQINNNSSGDDGGGALAQNGPVTISGSTFSGNSTSGHGGALVLEDILLVTNTIFSNNSAASDGGAVWTDEGSMVFSGSTFQNNTSTGGAGGAISDAVNITVTKSTFNHNTASGVGGAIDQEGTGNVTVSGSTFTQNSAGDTGGAINGNGGLATISVTSSKFTYNTATNQGGAIAGNGESLIIKDSTFDHNTSVTNDGGAIDDAIVTATNSSFTNNTAKSDGGAINSEDNDILLTACTFSGNTATNGEGGGFTDGGADSVVSVINCTISGNTAGGNGGGFAAEGVTLTMTGSTVSGNRSGSDGGGAYIITSGTNTVAYPGAPVAPGSLIANCTFANNGSATDGGGIDFEGEGDLTIINVTIAFNSSFNGGGIAQTDGDGTIHIGNTIVANNNAPNGPDAYNTQAPFDDLGHNLVTEPDGLFTDPGSNDIFNQDPLLKPLANNGGPTKTLALSKHSPAINAGDDSLAPATDQRGVKRHGQSDIGAYESN